MDDPKNALLERLAMSGLEACLSRLTAVSAGTWKTAAAGVRSETVTAALKRHPFRSGEALAVHLGVAGEPPFSTLMLFEPAELECVSKCYLGYAFPGGPGVTLPEEIMLLELGNIVLNSVVSAVSNALGRVLLPEVPRYLRGDTLALALELGVMPGQPRAFRILSASLDIRYGGGVSRGTVLCMIPEELAGELERGAL